MTRSGAPYFEANCHFAIVGPRLRRGHVFRIALRRAGGDPLDDRVDLRVAQRPVVLELLNADRLVEMPRRHLARLDAGRDRLRPGPRFLVRDERHRRNRIGPMARLALLLEDRRDVFGEGRRSPWVCRQPSPRPGRREPRPSAPRVMCRTFITIARSVSIRPAAGGFPCRDELSVYHFSEREGAGTDRTDGSVPPRNFCVGSALRQSG